MLNNSSTRVSALPFLRWAYELRSQSWVYLCGRRQEGFLLLYMATVVVCYFTVLDRNTAQKGRHCLAYHIILNTATIILYQGTGVC